MKFKNLLLLAGFGLFTAQTPVLQAAEENNLIASQNELFFQKNGLPNYAQALEIARQFSEIHRNTIDPDLLAKAKKLRSEQDVRAFYQHNADHAKALLVASQTDPVFYECETLDLISAVRHAGLLIGLFTAQTPIEASDQKDTRNSFVDTTPARIMKWSGAVAAVVICGAAIYYTPSMFKNLYEATCKLNLQTVPAATAAAEAVTKNCDAIGIATIENTNFIGITVNDFAIWLKSFLKDPLTFHLNTKESTLEKISKAASRNLPPFAGF